MPWSCASSRSSSPTRANDSVELETTRLTPFFGAQAASGAEALVPAILGGFKKQAQSQPGGLEGLGGLLGQLGGGGLLDDVLSAQPTDVSRGDDVLGQIFGSKDVSRTVAQDASAKTGLDPALLSLRLGNGDTVEEVRFFKVADQRSLEIAARVDWIIHSRLSFQLYLQPFIASGDYHDLHSLVRAGTRDFEPFTGAVAEPDFNFRSVRGSAVVRWEFRPGSALYVVWNENRSAVAPVGDFRFRRDFAALPHAPSRDVFLVKLSYWLPI